MAHLRDRPMSPPAGGTTKVRGVYGPGDRQQWHRPWRRSPEATRAKRPRESSPAARTRAEVPTSGGQAPRPRWAGSGPRGTRCRRHPAPRGASASWCRRLRQRLPHLRTGRGILPPRRALAAASRTRRAHPPPAPRRTRSCASAFPPAVGGSTACRTWSGGMPARRRENDRAQADAPHGRLVKGLVSKRPISSTGGTRRGQQPQRNSEGTAGKDGRVASAALLSSCGWLRSCSTWRGAACAVGPRPCAAGGSRVPAQRVVRRAAAG